MKNLNDEESDIIGTKPAPDLGPLFSSVAEAERELRESFLDAPKPAEREREQTQAFQPADASAIDEARERIQQLVYPDVLRLALSRANAETVPGIVADDVRQLIEVRGLSLPIPSSSERQRVWSWVGPWLASLARKGHLCEYKLHGLTVKRTSKRRGAHGNQQTVYLHTSDYRARSAA